MKYIVQFFKNYYSFYSLYLNLEIFNKKTNPF